MMHIENTAVYARVGKKIESRRGEFRTEVLCDQCGGRIAWRREDGKIAYGPKVFSRDGKGEYHSWCVEVQAT